MQLENEKYECVWNEKMISLIKIPSHSLNLQVFAVQHVDVCMFSNGKFKNVVADVVDSFQIKPGESYLKEYLLMPLKGKL